MSVINPITKKKIKIDGPTYKKLQKQGYFTTDTNINNNTANNKGGEKGVKQWVKNPKTGRQVIVGGKLYKDLVKEGAIKVHDSTNTNTNVKDVEPKNKRVGGYTVKELKDMLQKEGLSTKGLKSELVQRYENFLANKNSKDSVKPEESTNHNNKNSIDPDSCSISENKHKVNFNKPLSPIQKPNISINEPENELANNKDLKVNVEPIECAVCFDTIPSTIVGFTCKRCHNVCSECKKGLVKAECPLCRENVSRFFSPTSHRRQQEKYQVFLKEIEREKTENDALIAAELQNKLQNECGGFSFCDPYVPKKKVRVSGKKVVQPKMRAKLNLSGKSNVEPKKILRR